MTRNYIIRQLDVSDKVNSFKTGDSLFTPLKTFLKKHAKEFQHSHIAQTYVAVDSNNIVLGFVTLTCSEVDLRNGYDIDDCNHANSYDSLPAIKVARLAVDSRYRGNAIGENLISHALSIAIEQIAPAVGCRFIITDAKQQAVEFYLKQGFILLDTKDNKLRDEPIMFFDLLPCFT